MKRTLMIAALVAALAVPASFAQLALGVSGALYTDSEIGLAETFDRFGEGDGIFWGPFVEYGLSNFAVGLSLNFSFYEEDWGSFDPPVPFMIPFVDYDVNIYGQYHFLGYRGLLDPFVELGFGQMGKDIASDEYDPDPENPLYATNYLDLGVGFGVNLGQLGFFWKMCYMIPGDPAEAETDVYIDTDGDGTGDYHQTMSYYLEEYPLRRLKIFLGGKFVF